MRISTQSSRETNQYQQPLWESGALLLLMRDDQQQAYPSHINQIYCVAHGHKYPSTMFAS